MSQPCASNHSIEQGFPWLGSEAAAAGPGAAAWAKAPLKAPKPITVTRAASHPTLRAVAAILHNYKKLPNFSYRSLVTVLMQRAGQITVLSAMALKHKEMIASQQCDAMHVRKSSYPHRDEEMSSEWASEFVRFGRIRSDRMTPNGDEFLNVLARWWVL